jgi:hypothetical protein
MSAAAMSEGTTGDGRENPQMPGKARGRPRVFSQPEPWQYDFYPSRLEVTHYGLTAFKPDRSTMWRPKPLVGVVRG